MQLFHRWNDALKIFIPRNFKLLSLVSGNAARQTYAVWLKLFWPLFVLYVVVQPLFVMLYVHAHWSSDFIEKMIQLLLFSTLVLALRPSIKRKTISYFYDYRWHIVLVAFLFCADFFVAREHMQVPLFLGHLFTPLFLVPLATLMLFYYDTPGRVRDFFASCWRALKLLWFGLPFYILLLIATGFCYWVIALIFGYVYSPLAQVLGTDPLNGWYGYVYLMLVFLTIILFSVIPLAFAATFYTKKVHDYSEQFLG